MKIKTSDVKEAKCKFFAVNDRKMRNTVNSTLYTDAQKTKATAMKYALEEVYYNKQVHINYNKTYISIKVDDARVRDRLGLGRLEEQWQEQGITKLVTAQGISYKLA
jgi:hypothetical protein